MSITKNMALVRQVEKAIRGGVEKSVPVPTPGTKFERIGTIFSRVTGLLKSGVYKPDDIPMWYSLYSTFPPKFEPKYKRPPLDIDVKEIYYPEDKLRASLTRWETIDLQSDIKTGSQTLVATYLEKRKSNLDDEVLIKETIEEYEMKQRPKSEKGVDELEDVIKGL